MKKLFFVLLGLGMLASVPTQAQSSFAIQYSMGFTSGDTKGYVYSPSFRGVSLGYRYLVQPKVSVGIDAGWNVFYERRSYDTYTSGSNSLSGTQYRYINAVPVYVTVDYYLKPGEERGAFVGLGVGTLFNNRSTHMGIYALTQDVWAFALQPEIGYLTSANHDMDVVISGKYNLGFATSDQAAQSYFTLNLGFVFKGK